MISNAAFALRALGRLADAVDPMRAGAEAAAKQEAWTNAAIGYGNLRELLLTLGRVSEALSAAQTSVDFADRSGDAFQRMARRTTLADARHQTGDPTARTLFAEAERLEVERQPHDPILYSLRGYQYCDLLLGRVRSLSSSSSILAMHHAASIALPAPTLFTPIFQNLVWRIFLSARHLRPHLRPPELKVNRTHAMMSNGPRRFETNTFCRLAG